MVVHYYYTMTKTILHMVNTAIANSLDTLNTGIQISINIGRDLTFCQNDSAQCCLQGHIDTVERVARDRLSRGLRLQMRETSLMFNTTIAMIKSCKFKITIVTYHVQ